MPESAETSASELDRSDSLSDADAKDFVTSAYFRAVSSYAVMSREEEVSVARRYRDLGEKADFDLLVNSNLRFVVRVAATYRHYGFPLMDLIQEGNIGLVKAAEKFDPEKGFRFMSYAVWNIKAAIQEFILKNICLVKMGTTQTQRRVFIALQSKRNVGRSWDDPESVEWLAVTEDVPIEAVQEVIARVSGSREQSLDKGLRPGEDGKSLHDIFPADDVVVDEQLHEARVAYERNQALLLAIPQLDPRYREIVLKRFLDVKDPEGRRYTLQRLADEMGISKERVRQLEKRAFSALKAIIYR